MSRSNPLDDHLRHAGGAARGSQYDPSVHGPRRVVGAGFREQVYAVVARIPAGSLTTYGDVAGELGLRSVARQVGYALAALPHDRDDVPWHRVVNARGVVSDRGGGDPAGGQIERLRCEGIDVNSNGKIREFAARRHVFGDPGRRLRESRVGEE